MNEAAELYCLPPVGRFVGGDIVGDIIAFAYFDLSTDADFVDEYRAALMLPGRPELFPEVYSKYIG